MAKENRIGFIYKEAMDYLQEHSHVLTNEIKYEKILDAYLENERKTTMNEVFETAVFSFNDWNHNTGKNGIKAHEEEVKALFNDFDLNYFNDKVKTLTDDELEELFKKAFYGSCEAYKKLKKNVCDVAVYLSGFKGVTKMYEYFDSFDSTKASERKKLIDEIAKRIKWWGTALVPNWLKDIGMSNYSKPDMHVVSIISGIGLSSEDCYEVMEAVFKIADDYKSVDADASAFKLDRILWLIGTGNFYNHKDIVSYDGNEDDFIGTVKPKL